MSLLIRLLAISQTENYKANGNQQDKQDKSGLNQTPLVGASQAKEAYPRPE
jgi:hypothetical protein